MEKGAAPVELLSEAWKEEDEQGGQDLLAYLPQVRSCVHTRRFSNRIPNIVCGRVFYTRAILNHGLFTHA